MDNTTLSRCDFAFLPPYSAGMFSDLQDVFSARIALNILTCPFIILLNILVMVAVKTKRQLRTKSNIALACLATTDLVVGLVVQPLQIASDSFIFESESNKFCDVAVVSKAITLKCVVASGFHLFLITAERYVAIKHTFTHENLVTEVRIIVASGVAWVVAIMFPMEVWISSSQLVTLLTSFVIMFIFLPVMIYCNISVYMEVRRNQRQIATNQVTLEAKKHFLKNKKAFYTTVTILVAIFLCCAPVRLCLVIFATFNGKNPKDVGYSVLHLLTILPLLNSLFNPLIYAVKIRCFRVAFIQLLSRKTTAQAEEFERKSLELGKLE